MLRYFFRRPEENGLFLFGYFFDQGGVEGGGSYGHEAADFDDYAAVALDAQEVALDAGPDATRDADAVAGLEAGFVGGQVEELLLVGAGHGDEVAHLLRRNGEGTPLGEAHDVAYLVGKGRGALERLHRGLRGADENEVVDHGDELALRSGTLGLHVVEGNEILDAEGVEIGFEFHLARVGDAQGIPCHLRGHGTGTRV